MPKSNRKTGFQRMEEAGFEAVVENADPVSRPRDGNYIISLTKEAAENAVEFGTYAVLAAQKDAWEQTVFAGQPKPTDPRAPLSFQELLYELIYMSNAERVIGGNVDYELDFGGVIPVDGSSANKIYIHDASDDYAQSHGAPPTDTLQPGDKWIVVVLPQAVKFPTADDLESLIAPLELLAGAELLPELVAGEGAALITGTVLGEAAELSFLPAAGGAAVALGLLGAPKVTALAPAIELLDAAGTAITPTDYAVYDKPSSASDRKLLGVKRTIQIPLGTTPITTPPADCGCGDTSGDPPTTPPGQIWFTDPGSGTVIIVPINLPIGGGGASNPNPPVNFPTPPPSTANTQVSFGCVTLVSATAQGIGAFVNNLGVFVKIYHVDNDNITTALGTALAANADVTGCDTLNSVQLRAKAVVTNGAFHIPDLSSLLIIRPVIRDSRNNAVIHTFAPQNRYIEAVVLGQDEYGVNSEEVVIVNNDYSMFRADAWYIEAHTDPDATFLDTEFQACGANVKKWQFLDHWNLDGSDTTDPSDSRYLLGQYRNLRVEKFGADSIDSRGYLVSSAGILAIGFRVVAECSSGIHEAATSLNIVATITNYGSANNDVYMFIHNDVSVKHKIGSVPAGATVNVYGSFAGSFAAGDVPVINLLLGNIEGSPDVTSADIVFPSSPVAFKNVSVFAT